MGGLLPNYTIQLTFETTEDTKLPGNLQVLTIRSCREMQFAGIIDYPNMSNEPSHALDAVRFVPFPHTQTPRLLFERVKKRTETIQLSNVNYEQRDNFQMEIAAVEQANRREQDDFENQVMCSTNRGTQAKRTGEKGRGKTRNTPL